MRTYLVVVTIILATALLAVVGLLTAEQMGSQHAKTAVEAFSWQSLSDAKLKTGFIAGCVSTALVFLLGMLTHNTK